MREKEIRFIPADKLELRAEGDGEERKITGYVAVFNSWSPVYGDFREQIAPEFFDEALSRDDVDVRVLFNHDPNFVLGRTTSGTAELRTDSTGLMLENAPPSTTWAKDLAASMERGDITGASFSFSLPDEGGDSWNKGADGVMERTLLKAERLFDVGPVSFPWYPDTSVDVKVARRSLDRWQQENAPEGGDDEEKSEPVAGEGRAVIEGDSDEDLRERLRIALRTVEPAAVYLYPEAVYRETGQVVYEMREEGGGYEHYSRSFSTSGKEISVGDDRQKMRRKIVYETVDEGDGSVRAAPLKLLEKMQQQKEAEAV